MPAAPLLFEQALALATAYLDHNSLLALRTTSERVQDIADARLFHHIAVDYFDRQWRPTLVTPDLKRRLPLRWEDEDAAWDDRMRWTTYLAHTRVLDVSYGSYVPHDDELVAAIGGVHTVRGLVHLLHATSYMTEPRAASLSRFKSTINFVVMTPLGRNDALSWNPLTNIGVFFGDSERWVTNLVFDPAYLPELAIHSRSCKFILSQMPDGVPLSKEVVLILSPYVDATSPATARPPGQGAYAGDLLMHWMFAFLQSREPDYALTIVGAQDMDQGLLGLSASDVDLPSAIIKRYVDWCAENSKAIHNPRTLHRVVSFLARKEYMAQCGPERWALEDAANGPEAVIKMIQSTKDDIHLQMPWWEIPKAKPRRRKPLVPRREPIRRVLRNTGRPDVQNLVVLDPGPPPGCVVIDHKIYPNIMENIIRAAPPAALLALRGASHEMRNRADRRLFRHIVLSPTEYEDLVAGPAVVISAPHGRLPGLCWEDPDATREERSYWLEQLDYVEIVDCVPDYDPVFFIDGETLEESLEMLLDKFGWNMNTPKVYMHRCLDGMGHLPASVTVTFAHCVYDERRGPDVPRAVIFFNAQADEVVVALRYDARHPLIAQAELDWNFQQAPWFDGDDQVGEDGRLNDRMFIATEPHELFVPGEDEADWGTPWETAALRQSLARDAKDDTTPPPKPNLTVLFLPVQAAAVPDPSAFQLPQPHERRWFGLAMRLLILLSSSESAISALVVGLDEVQRHVLNLDEHDENIRGKANSTLLMEAIPRARRMRLEQDGGELSDGELSDRDLAAQMADPYPTVSFMTLDEYRAHVGEDRYALTTDPGLPGYEALY